jgi:phosphoglycolate phosphatase-like HAD superfamily hydrolase
VSVGLLLFDVDGTLVLTGGAGLRALDCAFEKRHGRRGATAGIRLHGMTDPAIVRDMYQRQLGAVPDATETAAFLDDYLSFLEEEVASSTGYRLMPGLPRALDELVPAGHVLGLATGNVRAGARLKLTRGGLWGRFAFGGFGDDSPDRAELVRAAAGRAPRPFAPDETWVIGDTPRDVAAARAAGFRALAVATGIHSVAELRETHADIVIATLADVAKLL